MVHLTPPLPPPSPVVPHLDRSQSEKELCSLTSQFEDFVVQLLDRYVLCVLRLPSDNGRV